MRNSHVDDYNPDASEFGGEAGQNRVIPGGHYGRQRALSPQEEARELRRAGLKNDPAGTPYRGQRIG